jgi:hypothetical protein
MVENLPENDEITAIGTIRISGAPLTQVIDV